GAQWWGGRAGGGLVGEWSGARTGSPTDRYTNKGGFMKLFAVLAVASVAMVASGAANAQQELAQKSGCLNCHAVDTKKIGPSYKDVAAKYKGKADAEAQLVDKL